MQMLVLSFLNKGNATRDEEEARNGGKEDGGRRRKGKGKAEGVRGRRVGRRGKEVE